MDRCSRHQWLHSFTREISCVCSMQSYAVDAYRCKQCSPSNCTNDEEPNQRWSSGQSEQSRVHFPKTWLPARPCKCSSAGCDFGCLLSYSLCACRRWDENGLSATRLRDCSRNQKSVDYYWILIWVKPTLI
jgi:hypothetical protein